MSTWAKVSPGYKCASVNRVLYQSVLVSTHKHTVGIARLWQGVVIATLI